MKPGKRDQVNLIWALGGLYLLYTGAEMLYRLFAGKAELRAVSAVGGLVFLAVGGMMLFREWRVFRTQKRGTARDEELPEGGKGGEAP